MNAEKELFHDSVIIEFNLIIIPFGYHISYASNYDFLQLEKDCEWMLKNRKKTVRT